MHEGLYNPNVIIICRSQERMKKNLFDVYNFLQLEIKLSSKGFNFD